MKSTNFLLQLLSLSALVGVSSLGAIAAPIKPNPVSSAATCAVPADTHKSVEGKESGTVDDAIADFTADFTAAESDAAAILFGCDCPSCINALRQLRNQSLLDAMGGHCGDALSQRADREMVEEVLEAVDAAEARGADVPLSWEPVK